VSDRLHEIALAYCEAKDAESMAMRRIGNARACEREHSRFVVEDALGREEVPPCWKQNTRVSNEEYERLPQGEWCQPCRDRQVHRNAMMTARKRRAALQGAMLRWYRAATKRGEVKVSK